MMRATILLTLAVACTPRPSDETTDCPAGWTCPIHCAQRSDCPDEWFCDGLPIDANKPEPVCVESTKCQDEACPCVDGSNCPGDYLCTDGSCVVPECWDSTECGLGEWCDHNACTPLGGLGQPCSSGSACESGYCGQVNDEGACVELCDSILDHPFPPYQCSPGYVCVGGGYVTGQPQPDPHFYCWPQGATDFKPAGAACDGPLQPHKDITCETNNCLYNVCAWSCTQSDPTCPVGMICDHNNGTCAPA